MSIRTEVVPLLSPVGTLGSSLFWGAWPSIPDTAVLVLEYVASPPVFTKDGMEYGYHNFQVVTRSKSYDEAMLKAEQVFAILHNVKARGLGGVQYDSIRARQRPFADPAGKDGGDRFRVLCNYIAKRKH